MHLRFGISPRYRCKDRDNIYIAQSFPKKNALLNYIYLDFYSLSRTILLRKKVGYISEIKEKENFSLYFARFALPLQPI